MINALYAPYALDSVVHFVNRAGALHGDFASVLLVQSGVLVAVLCLVELCLRRRVRAVVRYWLWALVVFKLMLPVTLRTPASVAYWLVKEPALATETAAEPTRENMPARPSLSSATGFEPPDAGSENPNVAFIPPTRPAPRSRAPMLESPEIAVTVAAQAKRATLTGRGWLLIAWSSGCVLLGVAVLRRAANVWQLGRRGAEAPRQLHDRLQAACRLLNLSAHRLQLRISDDVGCPAICGFWRPTILIPRRLVGQLDDDQFQLVFAHELFHWKRWDLQMNLLQTVLQVVYFYNPAVWFANAVLRRLREEAVDDAVLITAGASQERYSDTLLDVAARSLRPVEMSVRLIGILESRKALARRIHRLATGPLPKSARLGLWGFAAVALIGLALLPMAGSRRAIADKPADKPANQVPATPAAENQESTAVPIAALSGRITDENGKPVSDATVQLINSSNRAVQETATTRDGRYIVGRPWFPGEHRLLIHSDRCLGFTDLNDCPRVVLDCKKPIVRNFTLKTACQVRVQALDEEGHPIQGVTLFKAGPNNPYQEDTDRQGWMTIGGLVPAEYVFTFKTDRFAIAQLAVKIESPKTVVERKLVLKRGVAVKGRVLCSDGKPAARGRVVALPSWWAFGTSASGEPIKNDGTFVLPHIGPGAYDVTIVIPREGRSLENSTLVGNVDLSNQKGPLALRVDAPSPGSMVMIQGHFRFVGGRPKQVIWISAASSEGQHSSGDWIAGRRSDDFSLGPVPSGKYRLLFDSPEIETKEIDSVIAPVKDLKVDVQVRGPIVLRGFVDVPGAKGPEPVRDFLIRVVKLKNLRGTNFTPSEKWQRVYDSQAEFAEQVPGPGIYAVEATADGFATFRSEPINTDHMPTNGIRITLSKGVRVAGTVVDEEGRPIDRAVVMSLAKSGGHLPMSSAEIPDGIGVQTVNGRFQFDGLTPGKETFHIVHPDYALAVVQNFEVRSQGQEPLAIVMKRGGTVSGHVQDERGRLMAGVSLRFQRYPFTFAGDRYGSRFATAVTDANGYYEAHHLPEELIHILRDQGARTPGVFHQAVLPLNGKTRNVHLGGAPAISGRLFINGAPLGSTRLLLADEEHGGDFGATTTTDSDGAFVFTGVPQGKRYLYFSAQKRIGGRDEWVRVQSLDINTAARNFGRIDHRVGTVTVKVAGRPKDDAMVYLHYYDPNPSQVHIAARPRRPRAKNAAFVFENVASGKYDIAVSLDNQPQRIRQTLIVSPDNPNPTVTAQWPQGTASIRGTIDRTLHDMIGNGFIELYRPDMRWSAPVRVREDGRFELGEIPAGDYSLTMMRFRSGGFIPLALKEIRLAEGETKSLAINKDTVPQSEVPMEVLNISAFTPQGFPLSGCDIRLKGAHGALQPTRSDAEHVWFAAPPGSYQLSAAFPGAETVTQNVAIQPTLKNGVWSTQDQALNLTLAPIE